jgi:hypothetical protein
MEISNFYDVYNNVVNSYFDSTNYTYYNQNFLQGSTYNLLYSIANTPAEYSFNFMIGKINELRNNLGDEFNPNSVIQNPLLTNNPSGFNKNLET